MLCQECKKNNAVYFYSENINGKAYSVALCEECRKKHGSKYEKSLATDAYELFDSFMFPSSVIFQNQFGKALQKKEKRCSGCSSSFAELVNGKHPFCPECYTAFHDELSRLLVNIHGADVHKGKRPKTAESKEPEKEKAQLKEEIPKESAENKLASLKEKLKKAIEDERYEEAAKIRDKIKEEETK